MRVDPYGLTPGPDTFGGTPAADGADPVGGAGRSESMLSDHHLT